MLGCGGATSSGQADPHFASVKLLLSGDGADASTTFTDESPVARGNASVSGNAQVDTAWSKFGTGSILFDGNGDALRYADSADFNLSNGLFTLELWLRPHVVTGTHFLVSQWDSAGTLGWSLNQNATGLQFSLSTTGSDNITQLSGGSLSIDTDSFIAVDFDGTTYRLYQSGSVVNTNTTLRTINNSTQQLAIGSNSGVSNFHYNGWMDEIRLTKGVARYAGTCPVPVAAFPRS